ILRPPSGRRISPPGFLRAFRYSFEKLPAESLAGLRTISVEKVRCRHLLLRFRLQFEHFERARAAATDDQFPTRRAQLAWLQRARLMHQPRLGDPQSFSA